MGIERFKEELEKRTGFALEKIRTVSFKDRTDRYGWEQQDGVWYYTPFIENGRILDDEKMALKSALLAIAQTGHANFRFTANQNLILSDIGHQHKDSIDQLLRQYGVSGHTEAVSAIRKHSMACVALPTCPLALAEGQRYLPLLLDQIEPQLRRHGLENENIIIRMTGCPNGCARPYIAEIGLVGTAPGKYNLHLGGDHQGLRLNQIYRENLDEVAILGELDRLFGLFKKRRVKNESFGDFTWRTCFSSS